MTTLRNQPQSSNYQLRKTEKKTDFSIIRRCFFFLLLSSIELMRFSLDESENEDRPTDSVTLLNDVVRRSRTFFSRFLHNHSECPVTVSEGKEERRKSAKVFLASCSCHLTRKLVLSFFASRRSPSSRIHM